MDFQKQGGPAFPTFMKESAAFGQDFCQEGMTLRDWFAGQARWSMGDWTPGYSRPAAPTWREDDTSESYGERCAAYAHECERLSREARAAWAYAEADAMLAERSKP